MLSSFIRGAPKRFQKVAKRERERERAASPASPASFESPDVVLNGRNSPVFVLRDERAASPARNPLAFPEIVLDLTVSEPFEISTELFGRSHLRPAQASPAASDGVLVSRDFELRESSDSETIPNVRSRSSPEEVLHARHYLQSPKASDPGIAPNVPLKAPLEESPNNFDAGSAPQMRLNSSRDSDSPFFDFGLAAKSHSKSSSREILDVPDAPELEEDSDEPPLPPRKGATLAPIRIPVPPTATTKPPPPSFSWDQIGGPSLVRRSSSRLRSRPSSTISEAASATSGTTSYAAVFTNSFILGNTPFVDEDRDGASSTRQSVLYHHRMTRQDSATLPKGENPLVNSPFWDRRASGASGGWTPDSGRLSPNPPENIPPVPPLPMLPRPIDPPDESVVDPWLTAKVQSTGMSTRKSSGSVARQTAPPAATPQLDHTVHRISRISEAPSPVASSVPATPNTALTIGSASPSTTQFLNNVIHNGYGSTGGSGSGSAQSASSFPSQPGSSPSDYSTPGTALGTVDEKEMEEVQQGQETPAADTLENDHNTTTELETRKMSLDSVLDDYQFVSPTESRAASRTGTGTMTSDDLTRGMGSSSSNSSLVALTPLTTNSNTGTRSPRKRSGSASSTGRGSPASNRTNRSKKPLPIILKPRTGGRDMHTPTRPPSRIGGSTMLLPIGSGDTHRRRSFTTPASPRYPSTIGTSTSISTTSFPTSPSVKVKSPVSSATDRMSNIVWEGATSPDLLDSLLPHYQNQTPPPPRRPGSSLVQESDLASRSSSANSAASASASKPSTGFATPVAPSVAPRHNGVMPAPISIPNVPHRLANITLSGFNTPMTSMATLPTSTPTQEQPNSPPARPESQSTESTASTASGGQTFPETPRGFSPIWSDTFSPPPVPRQQNSRMTMPPIVLQPHAEQPEISPLIAPPPTAIPAQPHSEKESSPKHAKLELHIPPGPFESGPGVPSLPSPPIISPLLPPSALPPSPTLTVSTTAARAPASVSVSPSSTPVPVPASSSVDSLTLPPKLVPTSAVVEPSPVAIRKTQSRSRPPLPIGPRRPGHPGVGFSSPSVFLPGVARARNDSNASTILNITPPTSRKASDVSLYNNLPAPLFQTRPVRWRGLTMDAAKWTFTSNQLQGIVSRAIKSSAEASSIRLLPLETLDTEIPREVERLEMIKTDIKTRYKAQVRKRRMLLQSLSIFSTDEAMDIPSVTRLIEELSELCKNLDDLCEELHFVCDQLAQLRKLQDTHSSSALAMALRKLNTSFLKQVSETQLLRQQLDALEAERDEAWTQAQELARDLDDLNDRIGDSGSLTPSSVRSSQRSSNILAARKTSLRASKAGLRTSIYRRSQRSSTASSRHTSSILNLPSAQRSTFSTDEIPPVPPMPSSNPLGITTDVDRHSRAISSGTSPSSEMRAMMHARKEVLDMLGLSLSDISGHPSRPQSMSLSAVSRPPSPTLGSSRRVSETGMLPHLRRPGSLPSAAGDVRRETDDLTHDREAILAMLTLPAMT